MLRPWVRKVVDGPLVTCRKRSSYALLLRFSEHEVTTLRCPLPRRSDKPPRDADWDVICTRRMVPTHAAITETEAQLATLARWHGCQEDGWGFINE